MRRSTLADANASRPFQIYLELFYWLLGQTRSSHGKGREMVLLIDSTTIDLCKQQFEWAHFRSGKAGVKMHTVYDPDAKVPTFFSISTAKCHDRKAAKNLPLLPPMYLIEPTTIMPGSTRCVSRVSALSHA